MLTAAELAAAATAVVSEGVSVLQLAVASATGVAAVLVPELTVVPGPQVAAVRWGGELMVLEV